MRPPFLCIPRQGADRKKSGLLFSIALEEAKGLGLSCKMLSLGAVIAWHLGRRIFTSATKAVSYPLIVTIRFSRLKPLDQDKKGQYLPSLLGVSRFFSAAAPAC